VPEDTQPCKIAVITGAAVRIGRAIALGLAKRGYAIGLHYYRSVEMAHETAKLIENFGVPLLLLPGDLRDPIQIAEIFEKVRNCPYRLSLLVNSAAAIQSADLQTMRVEDWDATMALNLRAPWLCARAAAELMNAEGGLIVNMSDTGTAKAWTGYPAYEVSKAGLEMLTRLLARRLAPNIRVNAIAPGLVMKSADMPELEWQQIIQNTPLRRTVSTDSIVQALMFLLESPYITGETLVVDGGYRLI